MKFQPLVIITIFSALITASSETEAAVAFCFAPLAPTTYLNKPTKPFCAANRSCNDWEATNYRDEVERYFRQLKNYASDIDRYYNDSVDYIDCMSKLD